MTELTHLDDRGAARMVDVSDKEITAREATAEATILLSENAFAALQDGTVPKGDVYAAARIAGIMAAKKTSELIPLCHPLPLTKVEIAFEADTGRNAVRTIATVKTTARTGVEMESLTAASIAALTLYDMLKAIDKGAVIETIRLLTKSGGKSGDFAASAKRKVAPATQPVRRATRPKTLDQESAAPLQAKAAAGADREAFRQFMIANRLRATDWAKQAGVPSAQVYSYLTGKSRALSTDVAERLAKAARVRVEDMFRR
jgi:cyclic pyranopterin phosphate synthase